jgi:hypothetical protein
MRALRLSERAPPLTSRGGRFLPVTVFEYMGSSRHAAARARSSLRLTAAFTAITGRSSLPLISKKSMPAPTRAFLMNSRSSTIASCGVCVVLMRASSPFFTETSGRPWLFGQERGAPR